MGTFKLDITQGKSRTQLADDYLRCSREAFRWQRVVMALVARNPGMVEQLTGADRDAVNWLIEAYKD